MVFMFLAPSREKTSLASRKIIGSPSSSQAPIRGNACESWRTAKAQRSHMASVGEWRSATRLIKRPGKKNGFDSYLLSANISSSFSY